MFFFVLEEPGNKEENDPVTKETNDEEYDQEEQENVTDEKVTELKQASKKKRRSNIERSLEVVFHKFKETSKDDFER